MSFDEYSTLRWEMLTDQVSRTGLALTMSKTIFGNEKRLLTDMCLFGKIHESRQAGHSAAW